MLTKLKELFMDKVTHVVVVTSYTMESNADNASLNNSYRSYPYVTSYHKSYESAEAKAKERAKEGYHVYVLKIEAHATRATPPIEVTKYE